MNQGLLPKIRMKRVVLVLGKEFTGQQADVIRQLFNQRQKGETERGGPAGRRR